MVSMMVLKLPSILAIFSLYESMGEVRLMGFSIWTDCRSSEMSTPRWGSMGVAVATIAMEALAAMFF
jgi:hypothetical protein